MPVPTEIKLAPAILDLKSLEQKPIREGFGIGLVEAADANPNGCDGLGKSLDSAGFSVRYLFSVTDHTPDGNGE